MRDRLIVGRYSGVSGWKRWVLPPFQGENIVMQRYFFNYIDGTVELDSEGTRLANVEAARKEAVKFAGEALRDRPEVAWKDHPFRIEVEDESRCVLFVVKVSVTMSASDGETANLSGPTPPA